MSNGVPVELFQFITAVKPLKILQIAFENEKVGLPFVYPFYYYAMMQFKTLSKHEDSIINTISKVLAEELASEFKEKSRIPILVLAFSLTPIGKQYINGNHLLELFNPIVKLLIKDIDRFNIIEEFSDCENEQTLTATKHNDEEQKYLVPVIEKIAHFTRLNDEEFDKLFKEAPIPDDLILDPKSVLCISTEAYINRIEILSINIKDTSTIEKRDAIRKEAEQEGQKLYNFLSGMTTTRYLGMFNPDNKDDLYGHAFWAMKFQEKINSGEKNEDGEVIYVPGDLSNIALNALQLMSIPAGESSCERAISSCRWITGAHNTNESDEIWSARLLSGIASLRDYSKTYKNVLDD